MTAPRSRTAATWRRSGVALLGAAALAVGVVAPASAASTTTRIAGTDRYDTAGKLYSYLKGSTCHGSGLLVASGEDYHEALAGNFLAGQDGGGVVLTQNAQLPPASVTAIGGCNYLENAWKHVWVADGGAQISDAAVAGVQARSATGLFTKTPYPVERIHTGDAYSTAAAMATLPGTTVGSTQTLGRTAIIASGENFPDALAASPIVYSQHVPLLYTQKDSLPAVTAKALSTLGVQTVLVFGGPAAVSPAVEQQLAASYRVQRVWGADRQATAAAVADLAVAQYGFANTGVILARGDDFPDALAAGQFAGGGTGFTPLLLTASPTDLGGVTSDYLQKHRAQLQGRVGVVGGTAAVSDAVLFQAQRTARG